MQGHAADQLDVEVAHAHDTLTGFAGDRKGFGKQLVEGFTFGYAGLELFGLGAQLLVERATICSSKALTSCTVLSMRLTSRSFLLPKKFL